MIKMTRDYERKMGRGQGIFAEVMKRAAREINNRESQGRRQGEFMGTKTPTDMLAPPPPINKLTFLKRAAFVLNFKLWSPRQTLGPLKSTAQAPALGSP